MNGLLSKATVGTVGLLCKTFLSIGYCSSVTVNGLDNLLDALDSSERNSGRGVVTIANHISILDDPVVWGVLPARFYFSSRMTRWTLGASDIMFTNPSLVYFPASFATGKLSRLSVARVSSNLQLILPSKKLNQGAWIHLFGEGKVNQPIYDPSQSSVKLLRFKWGVGRILMETVKPPVIIPMWLTGFDQLMPERRSIPWKFFPRPRVALSVTFGKPVDTSEVRETLGRIVRDKQTPDVPYSSHGGMADPERPMEELSSAEVTHGAWLGDAAFSEEQLSVRGLSRRDTTETFASVCSAVTVLLQQKVEELGREVMSKHTRP